MKYPVYRINLGTILGAVYEGELLIAAESPTEALETAHLFYAKYTSISLGGVCPNLYSDIKGIVFNTLRLRR